MARKISRSIVFIRDLDKLTGFIESVPRIVNHRVGGLEGIHQEDIRTHEIRFRTLRLFLRA